jgi:hypothetical protein
VTAGFLRFLAVITLAAVSTACGSKGPPLAPLRLAPSRAEGLSAVRLEGGPITLRFVVPAVNDDGSAPPDISSMRIFALTKPAGDPAPTAVELTTGDARIATIPVRAPTTDTAPRTGVTPLPIPDAEPGATITWEDKTEIASVYPTPMMRYYAVAGVSRRGRMGILSDVVTVPLTAVPDPPSRVTVSFTESAIKVDWLGVSPDTRYRIYEVKDGNVAATPLNQEPLAGTSFEDPRVEFGVERCYVVRSAIASPRASIESAAAGPVCITPNDIFPPAAPANLTAVAGTGVVSLIWDRVQAADLAGYLVLRAEAPGDKLQPLFEKPIADTTYKDVTTVAGTRYVYAVVAVDKTANRSAESNRVEETGRN